MVTTTDHHYYYMSDQDTALIRALWGPSLEFWPLGLVHDRNSQSITSPRTSHRYRTSNTVGVRVCSVLVCRTAMLHVRRIVGTGHPLVDYVNSCPWMVDRHSCFEATD